MPYICYNGLNYTKNLKLSCKVGLVRCASDIKEVQLNESPPLYLN